MCDSPRGAVAGGGGPRSRVRSVLALFAVALPTLAGAAGAQERIGTVSQPLTIENNADWRSTGGVIPICWETPGYDREKTIVRDAIAGTWEWFANVRFVGWAACPTGQGIGGSGSAKQVRIRISPQGTDNGGAGGAARLGMTALSSADQNDPGVSFSFNPDGSAARGRVEYIGVHELGHVLGFVHEQDTPGNVEGPAYCKSSGIEPNATSITAYDRDSIMNYCNRDRNGKGNLTDIDIAGVQAVYGVRVNNVPAHNACASAVGKGPSSVAWGWNDGSGQTSIALFPAAATKFAERRTVSTREGGWADDVKWFSGDFDGDGRSDLGAAWNDGGQNTLTVRRLVGNGVSATHWAVRTGGWGKTTEWLPGDFNGDGRTDVAGAWNDGGQVSVAVFLSDGTKFVNQAPQWSQRDGGWGDTVKWFAADFNGDGRTDLGAAWNNNGATTLTIRQSTGNGFRPVQWSLDAGNWSDASMFLAGDFDGDGRADVARLWNDLSLNSISVSLSGGTAFRPATDWSVRDGGWILGAAIKWFAGDFDGDGRADVGAAWNDANLNTLTVRRSTGSGFGVAHWATRAGGWRDSATWCAGRFDATAVAASPIAPARPHVAVDTRALAARGGALVAQDPLAAELRRRQPDEAARNGFDIGMGAAEGQTAPGPGKQSIHDGLAAAEQGGFAAAVTYSLERNLNADLAGRGARIATQDAVVAAARTADPNVLAWLGFDIATGLFGDPALGAVGNTALGPGSAKIRGGLDAAGQRGFDAAVAFHLARTYR